jgi:hypothetical protein
MGRVYEALKKRAAGRPEDEAAAESVEPAREAEAAASFAESNGRARAAEHGAAPEYLFSASKHFQSPETAQTSASTEHTGTPGGSALPAGQASRAAGATVGAAGSTRTP